MNKQTFSIGNIEISMPQRYWNVLVVTTIGKFPFRAMKYLDKKLDKLSRKNNE